MHGGVRYLEKAFKSADVGQLKLVFEALHERRRLLANAPHLTSELPIMMPCYAWWEVPYFWAGLKAYDAVAGGRGGGLTRSRFVSAREARTRFPTLAPAGPGGASLKGAIVYSDGQFDDARLALALALTAAAAGATVANYAAVTRLLKDPAGTVTGAVVRDELTGAETEVAARAVVNACGPFADSLRTLSDPASTPMMSPSAGVHVTLPDYYSPEGTGLIVPKTRDGRVVFMLPWHDVTIAGTTDAAAPASRLPAASEEEIGFILDAVKEYLTVDVRRSDVQSAWSGVRPLAVDPTAASTASASRDHVVAVGDDGLITVAGGKWTTYRLMAEDAVNAAVASAKLSAARPCVTAALTLVGAAGWSPALFTEVAQGYTVPHRPGAIDTRVAKHLAASYGGRAPAVTRIAEQEGLGRRLTRGHPELEAEVAYAARAELCETAVDFLARRTRLAFTDVAATEQALPRVLALLAQEKGWSWLRSRREAARAKKFLATFKGGAPPPPGLAGAG